MRNQRTNTKPNAIVETGGLLLMICGLALNSGCASHPPSTTYTEISGEGLPTNAPPTLAVTLIRPGIWEYTSWHTATNGERISANGLVVQNGEKLVLIDTPWGERPTWALLEWLNKYVHLPVERALITQAHEDRMGGASVLEQLHIDFYAHSKTCALAKQRGWPIPRSLGELAPRTGFGFANFEVFYPGPAHSPENLMVWIPEARILFGGNAIKDLKSTTLGDTEGADLAGWPEAIIRVQARYPKAEIIIPAHGNSGGMELLQHTTALLENKDGLAAPLTQLALPELDDRIRD